MLDLKSRARDLIDRLRTPRVTHHQVSGDWEPYESVKRVHPVEPIKDEAAGVIGELLARVSMLEAAAGVTGRDSQTFPGQVLLDGNEP
jgi:hypothetical protein